MDGIRFSDDMLYLGIQFCNNWKTPMYFHIKIQYVHGWNKIMVGYH